MACGIDLHFNVANFSLPMSSPSLRMFSAPVLWSTQHPPREFCQLMHHGAINLHRLQHALNLLIRR